MRVTTLSSPFVLLRWHAHIPGVQAYEQFCLADAVFYDSPARLIATEAESVFSCNAAPAGWTQHESDDWLHCVPPDAQLPSQGWKIHASACLDNAAAILAAVGDYCVARAIPFKFIRSRQLLLLRNGKSADRAASGKFITVYPRDETQLRIVLDELGEILEGQAGPYILSDLRWKNSPLYVRYGGIAHRTCRTASGSLVPAIEDASGRLVPDRRSPTFEVPEWVVLPDFLQRQLAARGTAEISVLPYDIESALHFSNGGGVYVATDRETGDKVVLKEARPHAGLSADGADSVSRLTRERDILQQLAGLDVVPAIRGYFIHGEHHFLAQSFVRGKTLSDEFRDRYPLKSGGADSMAIAGYTEWVIEIIGRIDAALKAIRGRGIIVGDLHPSNIMITPDGSVVIIDLETARRSGEEMRATIGAPGFAAPATWTGDPDRYAAACITLHLFLPLTPLIWLDERKATQLAHAAGEIFPDARQLVNAAAAVIRRSDEVDPPSDATEGAAFDPIEGWDQVRQSMIRAILSSATPLRLDRLFPGDIAQFAHSGGVNIAHGAAGVLLALSSAEATRYTEYEEWLIRESLKPEPQRRHGFYDGLHGVAYTLEQLGRNEDALDVLQLSIGPRGTDGDQPLDLYGGLSGIALNLLHFAAVTGDAFLKERALSIGGIVAERIAGERNVGGISGGNHPWAGLMRGASGPALLFIHLYDLTGDSGYLDSAAAAIRLDLGRCIRTSDGALFVNQGWRLMPYLADGSAGIGIVVRRYLEHRDDDEFRSLLRSIMKSLEAEFCVQSGLFAGRAGIILFLAGDRGREDAVEDLMAMHVRNLAWHAMEYAGGIAFPGDRLHRLSMDLTTGTAGVMFALQAARTNGLVTLPFMNDPHVRDVMRKPTTLTHTGG